MIHTSAGIQHFSSSSKDHDRFLPVFQKGSLNHDQSSVSSDSFLNDITSQNSSIFELSLRDDTLFIRGEEVTSGSWLDHDDNQEISQLHNCHTKKPDRSIAQALGLSLTARVFKFNQKSPSKLNKKKHGWLKMTHAATRDPNEDLCVHDENQSQLLKKQKPINEKNIRSLTAETYVQAPGLRNDFYSNLVSWSFINNKIAVGLGNISYIWNLDNLEVDPIINDYSEIISCISCSMGDFLVVGTSIGRVIIISQMDNYKVKCQYMLKGSIHAITWFKDGNRFLISDHSGNVFLMEVSNDISGDYRLTINYTFKYHQQLVCGK